MKGTYCLIIRCRGTETRTGGLGTMRFPPGYYVYVGSGFGSLEARIRRHLRAEKRRRWHIDYLLSDAEVVGVLYSTDKRRLECAVSEKLEGEDSIRGFGCSDCRCKSHLHHFKTRDEAEKAVERAFRELGAVPEKWDEI
ncbi:DUF123 domain-containing protein [Methanothermobacter sp. THM-2]|uniref:GIY-YIG domain-containing protein n=2 Tax=Methanothermobacter marburgensis TaxID=145263 RepID=D9PWL8_METTM|nr:GIY-YIG nuclease family protein [Methanothermobacter sp. THM-2]ADL58616.1 conserved hypothetical protein [Methanothermobacter marburgensis str. Marburg]QHN08194.1 GIY-YIG nuclease family protein [Methanothermobacter sp. THM-2]WBF09202.1 GIY-YIG nuclease family protein [Methanothermobacter marburgensis]